MAENFLTDLSITLNDPTSILNLEIINIENSFYDELPIDIKISVILGN